MFYFASSMICLIVHLQMLSIPKNEEPIPTMNPLALPPKQKYQTRGNYHHHLYHVLANDDRWMSTETRAIEVSVVVTFSKMRCRPMVNVLVNVLQSRKPRPTHTSLKAKVCFSQILFNLFNNPAIYYKYFWCSINLSSSI